MVHFCTGAAVSRRGCSIAPTASAPSIRPPGGTAAAAGRSAAQMLYNQAQRKQMEPSVIFEFEFWAGLFRTFSSTKRRSCWLSMWSEGFWAPKPHPDPKRNPLDHFRNVCKHWLGLLSRLIVWSASRVARGAPRVASASRRRFVTYRRVPFPPACLREEQVPQGLQSSVRDDRGSDNAAAGRPQGTAGGRRQIQAVARPPFVHPSLPPAIWA